MKLESLSFVEFPGQAGEWKFEHFSLAQINLIVGRNAVGKTRLLNVISNLAKILCGTIQEMGFAAKYQVLFKDMENSWDYLLESDGCEILLEKLLYNGKNMMQRGKGGLGQIEAEDIEGKSVRMRFKAPLKQVAIITKRDSIQHPYLDALHEWGTSLRHFQFGYEMRPHNLALAIKGVQVQIDEKDTGNLIPIFDLATRKHGEQLNQIVIADMGKLGYPITELKIRKPDRAVVMGIFPGELVGIAAKEQDLDVMTDQPNLSQGMFRSLSLLIQTTHYMLSNKSGCIVIDDIGEGLDLGARAFSSTSSGKRPRSHCSNSSCPRITAS